MHESLFYKGTHNSIILTEIQIPVVNLSNLNLHLVTDSNYININIIFTQ